VPNAPPPVPSFLFALVCLLALWAATPALAADIYKYVDDEDVPHYTDQWQMIPEKYRSRVQVLDPSTGKIFRPESVKAAPQPPQRSSQPPVAHKDQPPSAAPADSPFYAAWLETFSKLSIPLPSQIQLGVGLMSAALIFGAIKIIRASPNPLVKLMLKGVIMLVLVGGAYTLFLAAMNARISNATRDPGPQEMSGTEMIQKIQATTEKAKATIKENTRAPLEKVKDATVGEAVRTRDLANQSNLEKEKILNKVESGP